MLVLALSLATGFPVFAFTQLEPPRLVTTYTSEDKGVSKSIGPVRFSPDGKTLAIAEAENVVLWDVATRKVRARLEVSGLIPFGRVAFTPDGKTLATGGGSRPRLWDVATGKPTLLPATKDLVSSIALSPDGKTLARVTDKGTVKLWDVDRSREAATLLGEEPISELAFSPDGKTLAGTGVVGGGPPVGRVWLWDIASRKLRTTIKCEVFPLGLAFSPDGQTLALGQGDTVELRDPASGKLRASWGFGSSVVTLAFSPHGRFLVAGGGVKAEPGFGIKGSGVVKFWDVSAQKEVTAFKAHEDEVIWVTISPDGKQLAVSTGAPSLPMNLWDNSAISGSKHK